MSVLKDEFAPSVGWSGYIRYNKPVFHRTNPHVHGAALCKASLKLDQEKLVTAVPAGEKYCGWCAIKDNHFGFGR